MTRTPVLLVAVFTLGECDLGPVPNKRTARREAKAIIADKHSQQLTAIQLRSSLTDELIEVINNKSNRRAR
jgi:hypothetical protein